jgi:branched-chain amino acid aminotransferase
MAVIRPDAKGLNYAKAVFEGIRSYETWDGNSAIFRLRDHAKRLLYSCEVLDLPITYTQTEIEKAIQDVVTKNNLKDCYLRPVVWDDTPKIGIHGQSEKVGFCIFPSSFSGGKYMPKSSIRVMISKIRRCTPDPEAKLAANYLYSYLAGKEARKAGYDEAIMLDPLGFVSELPGANIMIMSRDEVYTPPKDSLVLPGLTRDTIMRRIAPDLGFKVIEQEITVGRLLEDTDAAIAVGTAMEVTPIAEVRNLSGIDVKLGERKGASYYNDLPEKVRAHYNAIVRGHVPEHNDLLTYLYSKS